MLKLITAPSRRPACLLPRMSRQASVRRPAQQRREIYATMNTFPIEIRPQPSYCPSLYCIPPPYCSPCSLQLSQIDKRYMLPPYFCPESGGYSSFPEPSAILSATPPAGGVPDCFVVIRVVRGYASRCARLLRPRWPLLTQLHHSPWVCRPLRGLDLIAPKRTVDETKVPVRPKRTSCEATVRQLAQRRRPTASALPRYPATQKPPHKTTRHPYFWPIFSLQ